MCYTIKWDTLLCWNIGDLQSTKSIIIWNFVTQSKKSIYLFMYLFIHLFIYLFNVDTFSSNTFLIKIDSKLQNFIILEIVK